MTLHLGDVPASSTLYIPFDTVSLGSGSVTISGLAVTDIEIYKNGLATQRASDAGYTLLDTDGIDFDGITGVHGFSVDLSDNTDAGFYSAGSFYWVVVSSITVDGQTINFIAATFRLVATEATVAAIADAVWDETQSSHVTAGSFGEIATEIAEILADTAEIGVAGAGLTAIATAVFAKFKLSGNAASSGASLASEDVDIFNMALDLLKEGPIASATEGTPNSLWFLRNYVVSRDAELREHPWKFAIRRRTVYPADFVLEGITATLTGAWAPFKLTDKWHGDLITIRRSSDNTTDDFGIGTDDGDDPIFLDTDAVSTFIGSGSGFFNKIFDQSGNGNDISQSTTTKQPAYIGPDQSDPQINGDNDRVCASFDGTDDVLSTSVNLSTMMSVSTGYMVIAGLIDALTLDSATESSNHALMTDAGKAFGLFARKGGPLYGVNNDGTEDNGTEWVPTLVPFVAEIRHDAGSVYVRINGEDESSATSGDTSSLANILNIGDITAGSQALDFKMFAALTFSSIPDLGERDRIVARLLRWTAAPGFKEFGWAHRYPIPSDCLRLLPIRRGGEFEGRIVKHEVERGYILTDEAQKLNLLYIGQFTDAAKFDPLFKEALASRMAVKLAHWLTGKMTAVESMGRAYNMAIDRAKQADAMEGSLERADSDDVIDQRYDAVGVRG